MYPVKRTVLAAATFAAVTAGHLSAATLTVPGDANIFGAGHTSSPGGGELASSFSFASGQSLLTFSAVTGTVTLNGGTFNDPDGVGAAVSSSTTSSVGGISGIDAPNAGYLVGVFLTAAEPADPAPGILDFRTIGTSFSTLSPALDQTFFIGDGLTGDGTGATQQFVIPTGATRLFLGISDAGGYNGSPGSYGDNGGSFAATFTVVPEPRTWTLLLLGALAWPVRLLIRRRSAPAL